MRMKQTRGVLFLSARQCLCFLALPILCSAGCHQASAPTGPAPKDPPQASPPSTALLTGTLSCSGRGCHADFERPDVKDQSPSRFSYTRWLHQDPHTRAYQVLFEPLAVEMGKKLGIANVGEEPRCLVCHCTPLAARNDPIAVEERIFGVGCEACHGPAHEWLVPHRDVAWQKMKPAEKQLEYARVGMNWLQGQSERALVCAGCHIGAPANSANGLPARDMNHDFIAAGHPRLMFEYGSFLANEPKHWAEKDTRPDFEARAWLVGQAVSARAALQLLADRAITKAPDRVWPEFAEFDCYSCHHDLTGKSWRQERGYPRGAIGTLQPSLWYTALLPVVAGGAPATEAPSLDPLMNALRRRYPEPETVCKQATTALDPLTALAPALEKANYDRTAIAELRQKLVAQIGGKKLVGWDQVEQAALGLKALDSADRAIRDKAGEKATPRDEERTAALRELLDKLAFPRNANSPRGFRREAYNQDLEAIFGRLK
jgi:hypothetical protein